MADIYLTGGNDVFIQPYADRDLWHNYRGQGGNDTIKLYQGIAVGGAGNDRFEKIVDTGNPSRQFQLAYWEDNGATVNLAQGWALDGFGGRDTIVGEVYGLHGSGGNDRFTGDTKDNYFWGNGGNDTLVGGAGNDGITLAGFDPLGDEGFRNARLDDLKISVSADGRNATIKPLTGIGFNYTLTDIEYFDTEELTGWQKHYVADFIKPQTMAEDTIAAGGALRWNASHDLGTATTLSYSFVTTKPTSGVGATGFRAFTAAEQQLVRDILAKTATLTGLSFNEVPESGSTQGQLRFGVSQQAATKGVSWLPGQAGALAGDVWMDVESMLGIVPGKEGYQALLHEIGHALGLRHPRNVGAGDNWAMQLREQDDRTSLSVMSQQSSADGLFRSDWGPLDVLALRHLYGARNANTGDTVYKLGAAHADARTTIIDDGGIDGIDASGLKLGASIDLQPGAASSVGLTVAGVAGVDNLGLTATSWIENAVGSAFDDVLHGNDLANRLTGGKGNDWIDGGRGEDTAVFAGKLADYVITNAYGKVFVEAKDGSSGFDTLVDIERLAFADRSLPTDRATIEITTGPGNDRITGNAAANTLNGGAGADTMLGGAGNDTYIVDNLGDKVYETTTVDRTTNAGGTDKVISSVSFNLSAYAGVSFVENLTLTGTSAINGTGNALSNTLVGNSAANVLRGANGNDVLAGGGGADTMLGGAGNDTYIVDNLGDKVYETTTVDRTTNAGGTDKVISSVSFNLSAFAGVSFVENLTLTGTSAINGTGNALSNTLVGNSAANVLRGANGNDVLAGGGGADTLYGDAGNDLLRGGAGNDVLYGGSGNDLFRFDTAFSTVTVKNVDQIKDFNPAQDTIQLENSIVTKLGATKTGPVNPAHFRANTTGLAQDSNDYLIYETDTGKLFYDSNGSTAGGSVQIALLQANLALTSADYFLI